MVVGLVNYKINNLHSIYRMLRLTGADVRIVNHPSDLRHTDAIVLPGIGHFGRAMHNLSNTGLADALAEEVLGCGKPVLGICLGMQLMMHTSEEAPGYYGLAWLPGEVVRLHASDGLRYKVPHIGWNSITSTKESRLLRGIPDGSRFYFTHSYTCLLEEHADVAATTDYDGLFTAVIEHGSIFAVQFHPEKSRVAGTQLLRNFISL